MTKIAIVGMGCRFADAPNLQAYWELTLDGKNAFGPVPSDRWDHEQFMSESRRTPDKTYAPSGAFIKDVRSFPALALGIPPRRVEVMDPQQRFSLEVCREAIEDSGRLPKEMPSRTGVFIGITASEWRELVVLRQLAQTLATGAFGDAPHDATAITNAVSAVVPPRPYTAPGVLGNMCAATVAQELDLKGPAYTVDSACASGLIAMYDAILQLQTGAIDAALAGGVYLCLTPDHHVAFARIGAMSQAGVCRPFDKDADGFVQGDGAAVVLLKRYEDAVRDGDRIYSVIEGIALNSDGSGDGPMAPNREGQGDVIRRAWEAAGLSAEGLGYIETHGTGTPVGDPTEVHGLSDTIGSTTQRAALGSSKANIGHTMSAAGVAGLIRASLALYHETIPPMANFQEARADLGLEDTPFYIPEGSESWEGEARLAAVSSFGFGGTNAHCVLSASDVSPHAAPSQPELVVLSAPTQEELRSLAGRTAKALHADSRATVAGVARALHKRIHQKERLSVVASTMDELKGHLASFSDGGLTDGCHVGTAMDNPRVAFLFPGQGAQRPGMLRSIRTRFPLVADELQTLNDALNGSLSRPLLELIYPETRTQPVDEDTARRELTETANCQPALLACGVALARLLDSLGVKPVATAGHSLGEFTAAAVAGLVSSEDALRFVAGRGKAMEALQGDPGAMAALRAGYDDAQALLVPGTVIANINHPKQVVASGSTEGIAQVVERAANAGIDAIPLEVSHGFHSPVLEGLNVEPLLGSMSFLDSETPMVSAIDGCPVTKGAQVRDIFDRHALSPVRFLDALNACDESGVDIYLQVASGGPLSAFARGTFAGQGKAIVSLANMNDEDHGAALLSSLGRLFTLGVDLDLEAVTGEAPITSVPPTVYARENYWCIKAGMGKGPVVDPAHVKRHSESTSSEPTVAEATPEVAGNDDKVATEVTGIVARVSAYPLASLNASMTLMGQLGFDSLMVADLVTGLSAVFPQVDGIPQEVLVNNPTVQDVIDHVKFVLEHGSAANALVSEELRPYQTSWMARERHPESSQTLSLQGLRALVVGSESAQCHALIDALADAGAKAHFTPIGRPSDEPADLLIMVPTFQAPQGPHRQHEDIAGPFMAALDAQANLGTEPHTLLVYNANGYQARALSALSRCVAAEWPNKRAKACGFRPSMEAQHVATLALEEWSSSDATVDVRFDGDQREVLQFSVLDVHNTTTLEASDTVLITGGTRGIGLKIAQELHPSGARLLLMGRSTPSDEVAQWIASSEGQINFLQADVLDFDALQACLEGEEVTTLVHAAGLLADGALGSVDAELGRLARSVKSNGLIHAIDACGSNLRVVLGLGSHAARFGNRHQAHYALGNALMTEIMGEFPGLQASTIELGPWSDSDMVRTIPEAVRAQMQAEGVHFLEDNEGLEAIKGALGSSVSPVVHAARRPQVERTEFFVNVDTATHIYLHDHAIDGIPVLPLASAADMLAYAARPALPFSLLGLRLFQGITATEPTALKATVAGGTAEIKTADDGKLAYRCNIASGIPSDLSVPSRVSGGEKPATQLSQFYENITFHGPLLQGIESVDAIGPNFVKGRVRTGQVSSWMTDSTRTQWTIDPLAFDSAMQMAGLVAWERYERAGTPYSMGSFSQVQPWPSSPLTVEVTFGESNEDSFSADIAFYDHKDALVAFALDVRAELRVIKKNEQASLDLKPEWTDPSLWQPVKDMKLRLQMADAIGIGNPYFHVHEGTARDTTTVDGRSLVHFSGYNYLGLSGDARVVTDVQKAVADFGTSVSASRVASGERPFHRDLESELAECQGVESALLFTAGHAANVSTIGHLMGAEDLIIHDEFIHDSALGGIKMAGSSRRSFRHEDPEHLEEQLAELRMHYDKVLIIVEGVYSMDGDICNLPAYIDIKKRYGCLLMVDEAHSFGVIGATGQGCREHFNIDGSEVDVWMGTLSKSLASCGGWISGSEALLDYLRYTVGGFVFSAGMTPANAVAGLSSLRLMLEEPERVTRLQSNAQFFHGELVKHGLDTGPSEGGSAVVPVITGNSIQALFLSKQLMEEGINVQPIVYPAVADDAARLRFFLTSLHTEEQLARTASKVASLLGQIRSSSQFKGQKV